MLKIHTSYELRGARIQEHRSLPEPTVRSLTDALRHVAWVAKQYAFEIKVIDEG